MKGFVFMEEDTQVIAKARGMLKQAEDFLAQKVY